MRRIELVLESVKEQLLAWIEGSPKFALLYRRIDG
jgi:hypothetical protein